MSVLVAKILLAPLFVMGASLTARRYGAWIGGRAGGWVAGGRGTDSVVFALSHGRAFAADAAAATLLGIVSLLAFTVTYAHLASRVGWGTSLILGWGSFLAMTAALSAITLGADPALVVVLAAVGAALLALPRVRGQRMGAVALPSWDLPLRAVSALALMLVLTAVAGQLGAKLSGLLAPFPVIASVLAVFTHTQHGRQDLLRIMRGFVTGLVGYALFCFVLAVALGPLGTAQSFLLATAAALATQAIALSVTWRRREPVTSVSG